MKEHRKRSLVKTISWRISASLTTMIIVFIFTGRLALSAGVGLVEMVVKTLLYYAHERAWGRISWGRLKHPLEGLTCNKELTSEDKAVISQRLQELGYM